MINPILTISIDDFAWQFAVPAINGVEGDFGSIFDLSLMETASTENKFTQSEGVDSLIGDFHPTTEKGQGSKTPDDDPIFGIVSDVNLSKPVLSANPDKEATKNNLESSLTSTPPPGPICTIAENYFAEPIEPNLRGASNISKLIGKTSEAEGFQPTNGNLLEVFGSPEPKSKTIDTDKYVVPIVENPEPEGAKVKLPEVYLMVESLLTQSDPSVVESRQIERSQFAASSAVTANLNYISETEFPVGRQNSSQRTSTDGTTIEISIDESEWETSFDNPFDPTAATNENKVESSSVIQKLTEADAITSMKIRAVESTPYTDNASETYSWMDTIDAAANKTLNTEVLYSNYSDVDIQVETINNSESRRPVLVDPIFQSKLESSNVFRTLDENTSQLPPTIREIMGTITSGVETSMSRMGNPGVEAFTAKTSEGELQKSGRQESVVSAISGGFLKPYSKTDEEPGKRVAFGEISIEPIAARQFTFSIKPEIESIRPVRNIGGVHAFDLDPSSENYEQIKFEPETDGNIFEKMISSAVRRETAVNSDTKQLGAERILSQLEPQFLNLANLAKPGEGKRLKIKLHPEELGEIEITLEKNSAGKINAHFQSDNDTTSQTLHDGLTHLRAALENTGTSVGDLLISTRSTDHNGSNNSNQQTEQTNRTSNYGHSQNEMDESPQREEIIQDRLVNLQA